MISIKQLLVCILFCLLERSWIKGPLGCLALLNSMFYWYIGLLFSVLITSVITDAIKDGVGRPRPDFYWRCFPDNIPVSCSTSSLLTSFHFHILLAVRNLGFFLKFYCYYSPEVS